MFNEDSMCFTKPEPGALVTLDLIGYSHCDGTYFVKRHAFDFYVFEYIISGQGILRIDKERYRPSAGDVYIIPPNTDHEYSSSADDPWHKVWFNIGGPLIPFLLEQHRLSQVHYFKNMPGQILALFENGIRKISKNRTDAARIMQGVVLNVIASLHDSYKEHLLRISPDGIRIRRLLDENICSPDFGIEEIAAELRCSRSQVLRVFARDFRLPPYRYLLNKRLEIAEAMLKNSEAPLKAIADKLGFKDVFYFSNLFKRKKGLSPSRFREQAKRENICRAEAQAGISELQRRQFTSGWDGAHNPVPRLPDTKAFDETLAMEFKAAPGAVRGISGGISGGFLRLENRSPYPLSGIVSCDSCFTDTGSGEKHRKNTEAAVAVPPFSVSLFKGNGDFRAEFSFSADAAEEIRIISSAMAGSLPRRDMTKLEKMVGAGEFYGLYELRQPHGFPSLLAQYTKNADNARRQSRFLEMLDKEGRAGINAGSSSDMTDAIGRVWLADQRWSGLNCYGSEFAEFISRGNIPISGTDIPELYRTEAYGAHVFYHFPVPDGLYDARFHAAETYQPNAERGRLFSVIAGDGDIIRDINPVRLLHAFASPWIGSFSKLRPENGVLTLEFTGDVVLNAVEIEKVK